MIFFKRDNGEAPAEDFINSLDAKMSAKAYRFLKVMPESGPDLREPYSKHLDDGIFELRIKVGSDISRILYFFFVGRRIVMTNGFIKKTQKTPKAEIAKAKEYRKTFIEREGGKK